MSGEEKKPKLDYGTPGRRWTREKVFNVIVWCYKFAAVLAAVGAIALVVYLIRLTFGVVGESRPHPH